jgi:hypothetical protein
MSEALRRLVRKRAGERCEYSRLPESIPPLEPFRLEHIIARQHGGETDAAKPRCGHVTAATVTKAQTSPA